MYFLKEQVILFVFPFILFYLECIIFKERSSAS